MGRGKHEHCWKHVRRVENGLKWICNYCNGKFSGGATRIEAHLGGKGGGIRRCSNYPVVCNEGVHNNIMASTSSNSPEDMINRVYSTQDRVAEGVPEVIGTHTRNSVNHQNSAEIMNLFEGVNGSGGSRNVSESEINQIKLLILDLECEEKDIAEQLEWLESRGKKRKLEVDVWLEDLLDMKESVDDMNKLNDIHYINELIKNMKQHKLNKPLTLSTELVGKGLDFNIKNMFKLLEDDEVFVIGIYGMGGVGKTLLATLVENEVKRKSTFKDVFWITVSNNFSISKLQHDIAKRICVKLDEDDERIRANNLYSALEKKEKSVLILDDVWKYIDLQKIGIPLKVNGIKVILTTRLKHVCQQMDCQPYHMIQIQPLSRHQEEKYQGEQDWELFILKLGHCGTPMTLPQEIEKIASPIVARCDGLPLGITVMARIMKGIDDIHQWKHALNKINKLEMGQEVVEEVFKVLKRSFDNLMEKDLQNSFLYCALLSNDDKFEKDELIMKLVENGLINGNRYLEEIFHEGNYVLKTLESHSLMFLYDSFACTHRLVKDMACYILKENQRNVMVMFEKELTKIVREWAADLELVHLWNCDIKEIPEGMSPYCPRLSTLIINQLPISHVPESFFKYMDIVSILDLSFNRKLEYLPNSLTKLKSLVSLVLKECVSLKHVPPLEELQALSRLVISHSSIAEAPQGLEKLTNLKWLDLSKNMSLNLELRSFSSKLTKLEYLDLRETNVAFTFEDVQGMNMLECFGGTFDCKHYNQSMQKNLGMSFGLKTYNLIIGNVCGESRPFWWSYINLKSFVAGDPNIKTVQFGDCDQLSYMLPKDLTCLRIDTNNHWICLCDSLSCSASSSLSTIRTSDCQQLESLFCLSRSCSFCTKINNLEVLKLSYLESLIVVIKDVGDVRQSLSPNGLFSWLKRFHIYGCNMIEKLLPARLVQQLQNLEIISVIKCNSMKEIFAVENSDDNDNSRIILPKLNFMNLTDLPQLKIVCKGNIRCRSLPYLIIRHCPSLERHPTIEI